MKNFNLFVLTIACACLSAATISCMFACTQTAPDAPQTHTGIVISLHSSSGAKSILGPEQSSGLANAFEAVLCGATGMQSATLSASGSTTLAVSPGTYTVVVLAGYRRSDTATTVLLLGSGANEGVVVQEGQQTGVNMVLSPIDFSIQLTGTPTAGSSVGIHASGASRNPHVGMSLAGSSTTLRPRLRSTLLWNGYHEFQTVSGTETQWAADLAIGVPNGNGILDAQFQGAQVSLVDCGSNSGPLGGKTAANWKWLNRADMLDNGPLTGLVELNPSIIPPATGVAMTLTWE